MEQLPLKNLIKLDQIYKKNTHKILAYLCNNTLIPNEQTSLPSTVYLTERNLDETQIPGVRRTVYVLMW